MRQSLFMGSSTCALCLRFYEQDIFEENPCGRCPLSIVRDGFACDRDRDDEFHSPYETWRDKQDPIPMLTWLEKAVQYQANQKPPEEAETSKGGSQGEEEDSSLPQNCGDS